MTEQTTGGGADNLRDLQWNGGESYLISGAAEHWIAHRRDNGQLLAARSPDELREMIIEDCTLRQAARSTERHTST